MAVPNEGAARATGGGWLAALDRSIADLAENSHVVTLTLVAIGLLLLAGSYYLHIHSVIFDGALRGGARIASPDPSIEIAKKQVGYAFAPNWGLTGLFLLPYAIGQILRTRAAVEPLIKSLIERNMLVTTDFGRADGAAVLDVWHRRSRALLPVCLMIFAVIFVFVVFMDFPTVVLQWVLADDDKLRALATGVTLHHDEYEFDWSVAAAFPNARISGLANAIFDGIAYVVIAGIGAGFLFAAFLYFLTIGTFFSPAHLNACGLKLVPDLRSADPKKRLGFELFRDIFEPFVQAALATSLIALAMHLQNVFMRAPTQASIFNMMFGSEDQITAIVNQVANFEFGAIKTLFKLAFSENVDTLSSGAMTAVNPQTYASAIALVLIIAVVFGYVWRVLNVSAQRGRDELLRHGHSPETGAPFAAEDVAKLEKFSVWPLGWITLNQMLALILTIWFAMWYPRLLGVVVAVLIVSAAGMLASYLNTASKKTITDAWNGFTNLFRH